VLLYFRVPEENAKRPSIDDLSAKIKVLEAEAESLKNFMNESSAEENKKRKELLEKHAQEVSDLAEKLKKSHQRVQTLAAKNKSYEAEAEAIDKMIFRKNLIFFFILTPASSHVCYCSRE
jgi:predicted nuclease with TOPRIM domain